MSNEHAVSGRRAPWHLWLVGAIGLLWNGIGVVDNVMTLTRSTAYLDRYSPEQLDILFGLPLWLVACWTVAVWAGLAGAGLLLLRKAPAAPVLLASLIAMSITGLHDTLSDHGLYGPVGTPGAFVLVIFCVALALWLYARAMRARGVLR